jgi:hypothetical protein
MMWQRRSAHQLSAVYMSELVIKGYQLFNSWQFSNYKFFDVIVVIDWHFSMTGDD